MGSPHPKDLQISFGGFTQLVELDPFLGRKYASE